MALISWSSLSQIGYFETGDFRQLNVHQNQVGAVLAGEIERPNAVARADGMAAVSLQQVVEELHVELIVLHNHYGLRHSRSSELKRRAILVTRLALISLGSVRASHMGRGLLGLDATAKTLPGKGIGGSAQQALQQGMRVLLTEGHRSEPGMTLSLRRRSRESFCRAS